MEKTLLFTIANKNYWPHAFVLFESFKKYHSNIDTVLVSIDNKEETSGIDDKFIKIVQAESLLLEKYEFSKKRHNLIEFATLIKPFAFEKFLSQYERVIYVDPDCYFVGSVDRQLFDTYSIALTPHLLKPSSNNFAEIVMLRYGIMNLGFCQVSNKNLDFIRWWKTRLITSCIQNPYMGLYVDQKWVDLALVFFPVNLIKEEKYNIAIWNINERKLMKIDNKILVENTPVSFFHFSGLSRSPEENINRINKWINRDHLEKNNASNKVFLEVFNEWLDKLDNFQATIIKTKSDLPINTTFKILYFRHIRKLKINKITEFSTGLLDFSLQRDVMMILEILIEKIVKKLKK